MTPDTQVSFTFIFAIIAAIGVIVNLIRGGRTERDGIIKANMKLDEVCQTTRETRLDIKAMESKIDELAKKQVEHEQRLKAVEKKVEDL